MFLSPSAVHIPLDTTPQLEAKYKAKPKVAGYSCHPLYAGLLEELDACVGRVLDAVDKLEIARRTVVLFTSDNGGLEREMGGWPGTCNRPLRSEKGTLYEGGIRVPLIVRWPGATTAGALCRRPAISTDFYPTLLAAARIEIQAGGGDSGRAKSNDEQPLDGRSLLPLLREPAAELPPRSLFWHYPHYHHSRPAGAIRVGDWKALEYFDTSEIELFNLADDPSEAKNVAAGFPETARTLAEELRRWRQDVAAQLPRRNPAYNPRLANEWWNRRTLRPTQPPGSYP
jgi:uncharacterized sulfatase